MNRWRVRSGFTARATTHSRSATAGSSSAEMSFPISVAMERTIDVRARVRDHLELSDVELSSCRIMGTRRFAAEIIANDWRGQAFISQHAALNRVTQIDEAFPGVHDSRIAPRRSAANRLACCGSVAPPS